MNLSRMFCSLFIVWNISSLIVWRNTDIGRMNPEVTSPITVSEVVEGVFALPGSQLEYMATGGLDDYTSNPKQLTRDEQAINALINVIFYVLIFGSIRKVIKG
jgi:UDP-N-acetylmuramyl pentapeptide phosphotransferase/UDP-N-acetylglucosamine-1-phosphate transferase